MEANVEGVTCVADVACRNCVNVLDPELDAVEEKKVDDTLDLKSSELGLENRSSLPLTRVPVGGGGMMIGFPSDDPLVTVTGESNNPPVPLARVTAFLNLLSRSVVDPLLFKRDL